MLTLQNGQSFETHNPTACGDIVLVCEHASKYIPAELKGLGLDPDVQEKHIAWDPGAVNVARKMTKILNAVLVASSVSRLVYDCNRGPEAVDAMPTHSEIYDISGNLSLSREERDWRVDNIYKAFHNEIAANLHPANGLPLFVTIHSFVPVYKGVKRAVEIGVLHDDDKRLADFILGQDCALNMARNQPYGPQDGVTHTLKKHALNKKLPNVMIEIRNDLIATDKGQEHMAQLLSGILAKALKEFNETKETV